MRHATSPSGGVRDHDRSLSERGLDEARRVGRHLRRVGPVPDLVLSSTALRCRQTWEAVSAGLGETGSIDVEFTDALYAASAERLLHALAGTTGATAVLLLAHNPGVSQLAHELARGDDADQARLRGGFAPASVACFAIEGEWHAVSPSSARLVRFDRSPPDEDAARPPTV
jgi:phosphohistidine phosphatase